MYNLLRRVLNYEKSICNLIVMDYLIIIKEIKL